MIIPRQDCDSSLERQDLEMADMLESQALVIDAYNRTLTKKNKFILTSADSSGRYGFNK